MADETYTVTLKKSGNMKVNVVSPQKSKVHLVSGHAVEFDCTGKRILRLRVEWMLEEEEVMEVTSVEDVHEVTAPVKTEETYVEENVDGVEDAEMGGGDIEESVVEEGVVARDNIEVPFSFEPIELMWEDMEDVVLDYSMDNQEVLEFIKDMYPQHDEDSEDETFFVPNVDSKLVGGTKRTTRASKNKIILPGL